jgi:hypothetical protein
VGLSQALYDAEGLDRLAPAGNRHRAWDGAFAEYGLGGSALAFYYEWHDGLISGIGFEKVAAMATLVQVNAPGVVANR